MSICLSQISNKVDIVLKLKLELLPNDNGSFENNQEELFENSDIKVFQEVNEQLKSLKILQINKPFKLNRTVYICIQEFDPSNSQDKQF